MSRWPGFSIIYSVIFGAFALGLGTVAGNISFPQRNAASSSSFEPSVATHQTQAPSALALQLPSTRKIASGIGTFSAAPPTRSTFTATWQSVSGATGYLLDVSTSDSFSTYVEGYRNLDVGNVIRRVVTGLRPGTTYYYRVRPYTTNGLASYSQPMRAATAPTTGLIINPTFDSSITNDPDAAAIEAMITRAISIYESLFDDPITIQIRFRYSTTGPDGTPLPPGTAALSALVVYLIPWDTCISALTADATTSNDNLANASLPGSALSATTRPSSANGRAIGLDTPTAMFADGHIGNGGPYDGIVTLNSALPYAFTRPTGGGIFDAQRSTEHEMDEVIGLGSRLGQMSNDVRPQDFFSWSSPGVRNISTSGARYFSIDGGTTNTVDFNQDPTGDFGDWLSEDCPQTQPYVQNAFICSGQYSDISATSPEGINLDVVGYDLNRTALSNISTRALVQTGDNVLIGGFIVQGSGPKRVIIRAIGPELSQYGVPNPLADPTLELHDGNGALIASNDNWQTTIIGGIITQDQVQDIQSSGHAPGDARECAIIANLPAGNYTAIVRGVNGTTGVALVEVYDLSPDVSSILGNISTRSLVQTGDNVMIGGFIVEGTTPRSVIIRAIGPELSQYGVPNPLANPTLELHDGNGALIASNDNWQTTIIGGIITQDQVDDIQSSGHAPGDASESVIIANLPPGNYTAIVRGVNNTTGVALVEAYDRY
jgi:hypothetical protein